MMPPLSSLGRRPDVPQPRRSTNPPPQIPAKDWWGRRRLRYNLSLLLAGVLAFVVQIAVVRWGTSIGAISPNSDPDPDAMFFTILIDGTGYFVMMGIANVCYFLGQWSEGVMNPLNYDRYRRITFRLGFWFSVLLPFSIPAQLAYFCSSHPSWRQFHG